MTTVLLPSIQCTVPYPPLLTPRIQACSGVRWCCENKLKVSVCRTDRSSTVSSLWQRAAHRFPLIHPLSILPTTYSIRVLFIDSHTLLLHSLPAPSSVLPHRLRLRFPNCTSPYSSGSPLIAGLPPSSPDLAHLIPQPCFVRCFPSSSLQIHFHSLGSPVGRLSSFTPPFSRPPAQPIPREPKSSSLWQEALQRRSTSSGTTPRRGTRRIRS